MRDIQVDRIMTTEPSSVRAEDSAFAAQRLLADGHMHHLPVIDDAGRLVGIVSSSDFVKLYLLKGKPGKATVGHLMEADPVTIASVPSNLRPSLSLWVIRLSAIVRSVSCAWTIEPKKWPP